MKTNLSIHQLRSISFANMEENYEMGYISDYDWKVYRFFWTWTCPRFSGRSGVIHDRAFKILGKRRYYSRINRVRKWIGLDRYNYYTEVI